jgi:glutathione S-transferase
MPTMKLSYFDARGVAEVMRVCFAMGGVEYEDFRYPINFGVPGDFSTMTRPEFDAARDAGTFAENLNRLPILTVDGVDIGESGAIKRFVAKQCGLFGSNDVEAAHIDCFVEHVSDINAGYQKVRALPADAKEAGMAEWFSTKLPEWCAKLEKKLPAGGAAVGGQSSLADVQFWYHFTQFYDNKEAAAAAVAPCPNLAACIKAVETNPKVVAWLEKRPKTLM